MKKLILYTLVIAFIAFDAGYCYTQHKTIIKMKNAINISKIQRDSCQQICDSLLGESFTKDIQIGRYEYAIDRLEDENPKAYQALDEILSHTE